MGAAQTASAQTQTFDTTATGTLPAGWSNTGGTGAGSAWTVVNSTPAHSGTNSVFASDVASISTKYLTLPLISATGSITLDLWSKYATEAGFDGWTVEYKVGNGAFANIGQAAWTLNGYNAVISTAYNSPISGQRAFSGNSAATLTWTHNTATIPANPGDLVSVRFNMSSDASVASTGVWLDDITITGGSFVATGSCCSAAGVCTETTPGACAGAANTFAGLGSTCASAPCVTGACCAAPTCSTATANGCASVGGSYLGASTACDAGLASAGYSGPPIPIPDAVPAGINSTVNVASSFSIANVTATIDITHTWIGDLIVTLTHNATTVTLLNRPCGNFDNLSLTIDDSGSTIVCAQPTVGTVAPATPLAAFAGDTANGVWTLNVSDNAGADVGTLNSWSITVTSSLGSLPTCPGACCVNSTCVVANGTQCQGTGGAYLTPGSTCAGAPCAHTGACCQVAGSCDSRPQTLCTGTASYQGDNSACGNCPIVGACCTGATCASGFQSTCLAVSGNTWSSASCSPDNPCVGPCCSAAGVCSPQTAANCVGGGQVFGTLGTSCSASPCVTGGCCTASGCTIATSPGCSFSAGAYQGDGSTCGSISYDFPSISTMPIEDISTTGTIYVPTNATVGPLDDSNETNVPLGFTFNFYGAPQTLINIVSNGYAYFGNTSVTAFMPAAIPDAGDPNNLLAVYWCDLLPATADQIRFTTRGSPGQRRFIVQWTNVARYGGAGVFAGTHTFQIILYEGADAIAYRYGTLITGTAPDPVPTNPVQAVVGVEDAAGATGTAYTTDLVAAGGNTAIVFIPTGTACSAPATGACNTSSGCSSLSYASCIASDGAYQGNGSVCGVGTGACCAASGSCTGPVTQAACQAGGGTYQGDGISCTTGLCPQPSGGCCTTATGVCSAGLLSQAVCEGTSGNHWLGAGVTCTVVNCPPPVPTGACCNGLGGCSILTQANCTLANAYRGNGSTCVASGVNANCGICCRGATCNASVFTASACTTTGTAGHVYVTGACGSSHSTPCCNADYNKSGGQQTVSDIFNFLTDWFAHSLYAFPGGNGTTSQGPSGGVPQVAQIFNFLTDWFGPHCP